MTWGRRWVDTRGTEITENSIVAYNLSGDVAMGVVLQAGPSRAKIRLDHDAAGMKRGHISTVKRPSSIFVITKASK